MNTLTIVGRLTKDPESVTLGGADAAKFSVAVRKARPAKDGPEADFFDCTAWGKTAEFVGRWFAKGKWIAVTGRMESRQVGEGPDKRTYWGVNVTEAAFAGGDGKASENGVYDPFADE